MHHPDAHEALAAYSNAGLDHMEETAPDGYGAIVIGVAPCGCLSIDSGGITPEQRIGALMHALQQAIQATGGSCDVNVVVGDVRSPDPLSNSSTAPGPAA